MRQCEIILLFENRNHSQYIIELYCNNIVITEFLSNVKLAEMYIVTYTIFKTTDVSELDLKLVFAYKCIADKFEVFFLI